MVRMVIVLGSMLSGRRSMWILALVWLVNSFAYVRAVVQFVRDW